jgi:hypothetical protein
VKFLAATALAVFALIVPTSAEALHPPDITHHPGALPQGDARSRPAFYRDPVDRFSDQEVVGPGKAIGSPHTLFEPLMNRPEPLSAILSSIGRQDCFGLYRGGHSQ